jgi:hypothetical protein
VTVSRYIEGSGKRASGVYPGAFLRLLLAVLLVGLSPAVVSCGAMTGLGRGEVAVDHAAAGGSSSAIPGAIPEERVGQGEGPLMRVGLAEDRREVRVACDGLCSVALYGASTERAVAEAAEWVFRVEGSGFHVAGPEVNRVIGGTARVAPLSPEHRGSGVLS